MQITVVGPGRAGTAIHARLVERGRDAALVRRIADAATADVVILAVPDDAIAGCAAQLADGPWLVMLSGATPLEALGAGRTRRVAVHPMQTIVHGRGPEQLDGAAAGVTGSDPEAQAFGEALAHELGLRPLVVAEADRPLPHIACVLASNALVPGLLGAARALAACGVTGDSARDALRPLAERALDNALAEGLAAQPTGPVARGDVGTLRHHRAALTRRLPSLDALYTALQRAVASIVPAPVAATVAPALEDPPR